MDPMYARCIGVWSIYLSEQKYKAASVIIFNPEGQTLILKRTRSAKWMPEKWGFPGGMAEDGEIPGETASRETYEETKLKINNLKYLDAENGVIFYCTSDYEGEVEIDWEHDDFIWVNPKDLSNYATTPDLQKRVELSQKLLKK